ncbi:MAG TPA: SusC/RagA family protein [Porphyromonadaceae bacterium]|jgi:TonB-linked SusC/RagA family outer membrane protein|nr:SusC/RagA family protein [Porphyromonadaceae bacterium]
MKNEYLKQMRKKIHRVLSYQSMLILSILALQCFQVKAAAQGQYLTLKFTNAPISEVFKQIKKETNLSVIYNTEDINPDKRIDVTAEQQPIREVLDHILAESGTDLTYVIKDKHIVITKIQERAQLPSSPQKRTVSGVVVDESKQPLIGVGVYVVKDDGSTAGGTATDIDGNYSLSIEQGQSLTFSYIGYASQTIQPGEREVLNVTMQQDMKLLDEVVVTALGIRRSQKALSYNVQEVKQDELTRIKDANFINALSGKVAGVTINASSSGVGGASKVVMRGMKSIAQSNNALYVVDGIPMFDFASEGGTVFDSSGARDAVADINPEDIESLSVLTGAAASALYGNMAANGVILITTKKGKAGKTTLSLSQNTEFLQPFVLPDFQNRYGTGSLLSPEVTVADKSWGNRLNEANFMGYSPRSDYFRTGMVTTETLSFSTGTERNQTYASASAVDSRGMIPNNDYRRYNFSIRNTASFLEDKMTLDVGATYVKQNDRNMANQGVYQNPLVSVYLFPRGDDWNDIRMFERYSTQRKISTQYWPQGINEYTGQNPYWINYRNLRENAKDRYMFNANLSYDLLDWLNVSARIRVDNAGTEYSEKLYASTNTTLTGGSNNGLFGVQRTNEKQTYTDFLVNINKSIAEKLTLFANIGASLSDIQQYAVQTGGPIVDTDTESGIPNLFSLMQLDRDKARSSQAGYHDQTQSVFASTEFGYRGAYFLTLTGRYDWPSQLSGSYSTAKGFFYPSIGTSFILSDLFHMPKEVIDYMKLRASFASVGTPFKRFLAQKNYAWSGSLNGYEPTPTYAPMPQLKPERTNSWEVGLTTRLLKHFHIDISLYDARSFNQTFNPGLSSSSLYKYRYIQTGSIRNRGIELGVGYDNKWNDFTWSTHYTFSANTNKIEELVEDYKDPQTGQSTPYTLDIGGLADARFILKEGGSLGDFYSLYDVQRDSNGDIYIDQDGNITSARALEPIKLGSVFPKSNMSWRNDFSWRNFNFGFMLSARLGGIVYSATQAVLDRYGVSEASAVARDNGGVVVNGGDVVNAEKWFTAIGRNSGIPQYYTYGATNVRLQEARLGYTFTKAQLRGITDVTVSLIGRNLWMIYNKAPFDPESVATVGNYYQGIDYFMMPNSRNVGFSVKINF